MAEGKISWWETSPGEMSLSFAWTQPYLHIWQLHKPINSFYFLSESVSVRLFMSLWTVAHQAFLSMKFSRQEYWSGLPFPSPGDLPNPGIPIQGLLLCRQILYCLSHQGSLSKSVSIIWNWKHPKWFNQKVFLLVMVQWLRLCTSNAVGGGFDSWTGNEDPTCCVVWQNEGLLKNLLNPFTSFYLYHSHLNYHYFLSGLFQQFPN